MHYYLFDLCFICNSGLETITQYVIKIATALVYDTYDWRANKSISPQRYCITAITFTDETVIVHHFSVR